MIRCRVCDREHDPSTKTCECGADLALDGIAIGTDARFGDADLGDALPDLGDLPDLDAPSTFPDDQSLTASLSIPDIDTPPATPTPPPAPPLPDPPLPDTPLVDTPPSSDATTPFVPPPPPSAPSPGRTFAVKPTAGSGETRRGESPGAAKAAEEPSKIAPVPTAPVIDPSLASSVFADDDEDEVGVGPDGLGGLREGLRVERSGGVTVCPTCGRDVAAGRRFCVCGHQLEVPVRVPVETANQPSKLTSFWRRLTGTGLGPRGDDRSWGQRAKDTGARGGMRYATRLSARTRFGRIGMLLAGGAGLIMVVGPLRQQVKDLPNLFEAAQPAVVSWNPAGACDSPADEDIDNPWQTRWPSEGGASDETTCPGVFDTITGTFPQPVDVDRLTITIGPTSGQTTVNRGQPVMSPAVVVIEFTHEGDRDPTRPDPIPLEDTAEQQEFRMKVRDATGFTITITDVVGKDDHPWPELEIVQIGQVAFFTD